MVSCGEVLNEKRIFLIQAWEYRGVASSELSITVRAPQHVVWAELADLASHTDWMRDARSIGFETQQRRGVGTRMVVETRIGPFRTVDVLEVTKWVEGEAIGVTHHGRVRGQGLFELGSNEKGTAVAWSERLLFPWYLGGPVAAALAAPVLRSVWRRNLASFKERVELGGSSSGDS